MKQSLTLGLVGGVVIVIAIVIILQIDTVPNENNSSLDTIDQEIIEEPESEGYTPQKRDWQTSGPFQIDRSQYVLGENIFININNLASTDKGQIAFLRPLNETHLKVYTTIPFDGSLNSGFNQYFKPSLSKFKGTCSSDELLGNWTVVFQGTSYENLSFEIINVTVPGEEINYEPIC